MIKVILLEVYLPVVLSHGLQHIWKRLDAAIPLLGLLEVGTVCLQTNYINSFKVKSRQSNGIRIRNRGTTRLPKVTNDQGNGGIVVPVYSSIYCPMKIGTKGRIPDFNFRMLSTNAGSPVQIKSNIREKLLKLAKHCKKNPNRPVSMEKIYRLMYDPHLYEIAYGKLKSKFYAGNKTPGITPTTLDGMSMEVIEEIISKLKDDSFMFSPDRRVDIPKACIPCYAGGPCFAGRTRPLTIAPLRDQIVQEVMRMILEAIFEPTFSDNSYGFRPNRSSLTAFRRVKEKFGVAT